MFFIVLLAISFLYCSFSPAMEIGAKKSAKPNPVPARKSTSAPKTRLSILGACAQKDEAKLLKCIQDKTIDVFKVDSRGETAMHKAARLNFIKAIHALRERAPSLTFNRDRIYDNMPLHFAVWNGNTPAVEALLEYHQNVNVANKKKEIPLVLAAMKGYLRIAQLLLNRGALVKATDNEGKTPLHHAAQNGKSDLALLLLMHGASLDALDNAERTSAQLAREHKHEELALVLEDLGKRKVLVPAGASLPVSSGE